MILKEEIPYLRELAKKQLECAKKPVMTERANLWYRHNDLKDTCPPIYLEEITFWDDIRPELRCTSELGREMENQMLKNIIMAELVDDDRVIPDFYEVEIYEEGLAFGVEQKKIYASDGLGYHIEPVLEDLEEDLEKLSYTEFKVNREALEKKTEVIREIIGDILSVKLVNATNRWELSVPAKAIQMMGMENMFVAMMTNPDEFHQLMNFITEDRIRMLRWEEEQGLIWQNGGNDYMGSGNICFTNDLPIIGEGERVTSRHTWGHINSQETIGISPTMFREFILPYMKRVASEFGMIYYGCCEPVSDFWDGGIEEISNIRKLSISPWCNEEMMSERLAGSKIIYSRKPSPNFLGVQANLDEEEFRNYIRKTAQLTKGCYTEYIFRDIYKLHGNTEKLKRVVEIVKEEVGR